MRLTVAQKNWGLYSSSPLSSSSSISIQGKMAFRDSELYTESFLKPGNVQASRVPFAADPLIFTSVGSIPGSSLMVSPPLADQKGVLLGALLVHSQESTWHLHLA